MTTNTKKVEAQTFTAKYYPLTASQQRIWFITQLNPDSPAYNCPTAIRLQGELDYSALNRAFSNVINRHSSFRSNFITKEGQPFRVIRDRVNFQLSLVDLSGLNEEKSQIEVQNRAQQEAITLFNLVTDLPIRGQLLKLGDRDNVLLLTIHHIIWDYWSWWLLWQEISQVYNGIAQQKEYSLKPLPISYEDYGIWQQEQILTSEWKKQEKYWCSRFANELPLLDLPNDFNRPSIQTYQGNTQGFILDATVSQKLKKLALTTRTSLLIVLLAAYNSFLYRYTNQKDFIVGVPVAGRNYLNVKSLIGCFVNTLPIRSDLAENPTFIELIQKIGREVLAAHENQLYPFEELVKALNPKRDMSRSPLFQTVFMLRDELLDGFNLLDIEHRAIAIKEKTAKFDLTVCVYPSAESFQIEFEYSTDLFKAETIKGMMDNFATLLTSIAAAPDTPIAQLNLLSPQEKQKLLNEWNATAKPYSQDSFIHHLIEAQVTKTPDSVAVVFEEQTLTYAQLNQQANQLARYLQKQGVTTETLVGISIERSHLMLVSLLAVLKAGGAYVPLDPSYPQDRLALMVEDSQLSILITQQPAINIIPHYSGININLDTDRSKIALESTENLNNSDVTAQNLAYIIYTSGSTGKPKGVQLAHQGVVNFLTSMAREPGITSDDILLAVTSISFDIAVLELFLPLTVGAKVIIASPSETINGIKLLKLIPKAQVTMMQATPATWKMLQAGKWDTIQPIKMLCGGEALSEELAAWMLQHCTSLWNVYGPTEATVWATIHQVQPDDKPIPIGHPLANTQIQILDRYGQLVPIGVPGEIHIGGVQLARGYLHRPELTEERFISNPFAASEKLYKTGDLGRYLRNGEIECLGRIDRQVKIRGFRIELGEIEAVLSQYPSVAQTVVIDREYVPGDKRLVAYVVLSDRSSILNPQSKIQNQLRDFLKQKLPDYMIPFAFVLLETLPLTPNGKIDRRALPAPNQVDRESEANFVAPRDDLELQLTKIWEEVLGIQPIGIKDNFFDLGGHSILAVSLFDRIEKQFNRVLPLATLFQAPTIEQIASLLCTQNSSTCWSSLVPIKPTGSKLPLFCVHGVGGDVLTYRELALHLDPEQPFYGLKAQGLDKKQSPYTRIEDMASHYVKDIRSIQSQGPYLIGGVCFGGVVALEMAQQLHEQGQSISLLVLLDGDLPNYRLFNPLSPQDTIKQPDELSDVHRKAMLSYYPKLYLGQAVLFLSETRLKKPQFAKSWSNVVSDLQVHTMPGVHGEPGVSFLREPNVRVLSEKLTACIDRASIDRSKINQEAALFRYQENLELKTEQPFWVYKNLGDALNKQCKLESAIIAYQKSIRLQRLWIYKDLLDLFTKGFRLEEISLSYQQEINLKPQISNIDRSLNRQVSGEVDLIKADDRQDFELEFGRSFRFSQSLANDLIEQGKLQEAIISYQKLIKLQPLDIYNKLKTIVSDRDRIIYVCQEAVNLQPDPDLYWRLGTLKHESGDLESAIANYRISIDLNPERVERNIHLGNILKQKGEWDAAIAAYQRAADIQSENPNIYCYLGRCNLEIGDLEIVKTYFHKAIKFAPHNAEGYRGMGDSLNLQNRLKESLSYYKKAIQVQPDYAIVYWQMGSIYQKQGDFESAIENYQKSLKLDSNNIPKLIELNLGDCYCKINQIEAAITYYKKFIEFDPNHFGVYQKLGNIFNQQGNIEEAIANYQKVIELNPSHRASYVQLGNLLSQQNQLEAAISNYQAALKLQPEPSGVYSQLANTQYQQGNLKEAVSNYQKAIALNPKKQ